MSFCKKFEDLSCIFEDDDLKNYLKKTHSQEWFDKFTKLLLIPPKYSTIRVNRTALDIKDRNLIKQEILKITKDVDIQHHSIIDDCVLLRRKSKTNMIKLLKKCIVVDEKCAVAVLRGSCIFSPGIMAMTKSNFVSDKVSVLFIYDHLRNQICKGEIISDYNKLSECVHIGNGVLKMSRKDIFAANTKGIAVEMINEESLFPTMSLHSYNESDKFFIQNESSMFVSHILNPQENMNVLDMCAAPGGKTTHLAQLMNNKGTIIAFDRSKNKINKIKKNQKTQKLSVIKAYKQDSTKATEKYSKESFDMILCDVPCSTLGKRPQFYISHTLESIKDLSLYQRRIFKEGFQLLKTGGYICYSTCSLCPIENEVNVRYFVRSFAGHIRLVSISSELKLNSDESKKYFGLSNILQVGYKDVLKFDPTTRGNENQLGFFIAKFQKI